MPLGVDRPVGAVAIELVSGLRGDHRAGRARPSAVSIDILAELDVQTQYENIYPCRADGLGTAGASFWPISRQMCR